MTLFSVICLWPHDTPGRHVTLVSYDTLGCHGTPPPCPVITVATEEEHARDAVAADARAAAGGRWRRWLARAARCEAEAAARGRAAPALVLARLLHLHLPPRHPGAVDLSDLDTCGDRVVPRTQVGRMGSQAIQELWT